MFCSINHCLVFSLAIILLSVSNAQKLPRPTALLFPIRKDAQTLQYFTTILLERSVKGTYADLVLDLGGQYTWFDCDGFSLPSYRPLRCGSTKCTSATSEISCIGCNGPRVPGCTNNTCGVSAYNTYTRDLFAVGLGEGLTFVESTNGKDELSTYQAPGFKYACVPLNLLQNLSTKTQGMAGIAMSRAALHTQLSSQFKLSHKFATCMPSMTDYLQGALFIGGGPYILSAYTKNIADELISTPLIINPVSSYPSYTVGDGSEYFIQLISIQVDHKNVTLNSKLLSIDKKGNGGTKLSTVTPFTSLETSIYKALVKDFVSNAKSRKIKRVASVAPFGACFSSKSIANSTTGPVVPYIDLVLGGGHWRFYGANSMVAVNKDVMCLAFVDGGLKPRASVVIGGHQMENYLIEFDVGSLRLGISTSLLLRNTSCSQPRGSGF